MGEEACYFGPTLDFSFFFLANTGLTGEYQVVSRPHGHSASAHVSVTTQWFTGGVRQDLTCTSLYFKGSLKADYVYDISCWFVKFSQLGQ